MNIYKEALAHGYTVVEKEQKIRVARIGDKRGRWFEGCDRYDLALEYMEKHSNPSMAMRPFYS